MKQMSTVDILRGALALLVTPEGWTQGTAARNAHGVAVSVDDPAAVCFCPVAAIHRTVGVVEHGWRFPKIREAAGAVSLELARADLRLDHTDDEIDKMGFGGVAELMSLNDLDEVGHGQVVAAFCAAIIRA